MSEKTKEKYYGKNKTLETEVGNNAAEGAASPSLRDHAELMIQTIALDLTGLPPLS